MSDLFTLLPHGGSDVVKEAFGIPFSLAYDGQRILAFDSEELPVQAEGGFGWAYFTGMVNRSGWCSEWWGQEEPRGSYVRRIFIGDQLGQVRVVYQDWTQEIIPLIFGLNVWNYDLYHAKKPYETYLTTFDSPYDEPFRSDPEAKQLLDDALCLNEADGDKGLHYMMCLPLKDKPLMKVLLCKEASKWDDVFISGVTLARKEHTPAADTRIIDPKIFLNRSYTQRLDKLSRRLYQYLDQIPDQAPLVDIPDRVCPKVRFSGSNIAQLYTNVYNLNMDDMAKRKVDADGMTHTSSPGTANFSGYIGLGTFRTGSASYAKHIWTRDVGRVLTELAFAGATEKLKAAADCLHDYLDSTSWRFPRPNWKRIANARDLAEDVARSVAGKENDGHASIMLFIARLFFGGIVDAAWITERADKITDAAEWFCWQMDSPEESNFDKVLYSDSEASTQTYGGYDLYSNIIACYALEAYGRMAAECGMEEKAARWRCYSQRLYQGLLEVFTLEDPRCGRIFTDNTYDCWTYEYKRFGPLFLLSDLETYDPAFAGGQLYEIARNTLKAQKEDYLHPWSGRQMGYGQGYLAHLLAMLDDYEEFTESVKAATCYSYHHTDCNYIVPEGVIVHPSRRYWFRNCDQGNAVQQAEVCKIGRMMLGLDDLRPQEGLCLVPRLPDDFSSMEAEAYPVTIMEAGVRRQVAVSYRYVRTEKGYKLTLESLEPLQVNRLRFGPFPEGTPGFASCGEPMEVRQIGGRTFVYVTLNRPVTKLELEVACC